MGQTHAKVTFEGGPLAGTVASVRMPVPRRWRVWIGPDTHDYTLRATYLNDIVYHHRGAGDEA